MKLPKKEKTKLQKESKNLIEGSLPPSIDENLLDKLKQLRREIAARESVPAYIIFSDSSLRDMCRKKPVSLVQFQSVNGVGQVKLEKYGEAFIQLIKGYSNITL
jgi:ATP-dependent DNA helicase RecQ